MTDAFMSYREEFEAYRDDAMKDIKQISRIKDAAERRESEQRAQSNIAEAERYVKLLESEARAGDAQARRKMQQQVRSCKGHIQKLRNNYERAQLLAESSERHRNAPKGSNPKENAANYQQRLDKAGDHLQDAQRRIAETEEIAVNIDGNLARQREEIERAQNNVAETTDNTREAGTHLTSLNRKATFHTIFLYLVILALMAGIVFAVYTKFIKKDEDEEGEEGGGATDTTTTTT